jgi:hypothetical protein
MASIRKTKKVEYHCVWRKAVSILKQDGHLLFGGQEIWEGFMDEKIKAMYKRLMSPLDNLSEMLFFFATI